jgi:hypothetical protein
MVIFFLELSQHRRVFPINFYYYFPLIFLEAAYISDEEQFIEEISEQIESRIKALKTERKITKEDLVKPRLNEENVYRSQIEKVYKSGKKLEAMAYREDFEDNLEMQNEIKSALEKNKNRKIQLLKEGKPVIDFDYPRLL